MLLVSLTAALAQPVADEPPAAPVEAPGLESPLPAQQVELEPARDRAIAGRLRAVLAATPELEQVRLRVRSGVVFLEGRAADPRFAELASQIATNTEGVVAVVNRIEVVEPLLDLDPAQQELRAVGREVLRALPSAVLGLLLVGVGVLLGRLASRVVRPTLERRIRSRLLRTVAAKAVGAVVVVLGVYLALRVAGLTGIAVTVLGGTGLVGLVLGIAFRGITENFLASVLLSVQQPFREGDLVEVAGIVGYVQGLTSRATLLGTLDGTQVQIPNATVFGAVIKNWTSSPNRREDFVVGIGYDDSVPRAQQLALEVLRAHEAVLDDPEPLVLVERLGPATVDLRVYFWLDGRRHSWLKVRSSVIRLVKRAFQEGGVSLPDEAREVVFPNGVPVVVHVEERPPPPPPEVRVEPEQVTTSAEGGLQSDADEIHRQASQAWQPDENLLRQTRQE